MANVKRKYKAAPHPSRPDDQVPNMELMSTFDPTGEQLMSFEAHRPPVHGMAPDGPYADYGLMPDQGDGTQRYWNRHYSPDTGTELSFYHDTRGATDGLTAQEKENQLMRMYTEWAKEQGYLP